MARATVRVDFFGKTLLGVMSFGAGTLGTAAAQSESLFVRDRNISVRERERPQYEAQGIRAGQFVVRPQLDVGLGYSSNVFAISDVPEGSFAEEFTDQGDYFLFLRPSVRADSNWNRHRLSFGTYGEMTTFNDFDTEAIFNTGVFVDSELDITRATQIIAGASYDRRNESRRVNNSAFLSDEPVEFDRASAFLGFSRERGRLKYLGRVDTQYFDYDDVILLTDEFGVDPDLPAGAPFSSDQDFRDRVSVIGTAEIGVALTRDAAAFVSGSYNEQFYSEADIEGRERDSDGYRVTAGLDVDISRLIRGRIGVGYFEQSFDDPAFENNSGVAITSALEWFPSPLTTVTMTLERGAAQSAVFVSGGFVSTELLINVDHELRRNLIISVYSGISFDRFDDPVALDPALGVVTTDFEQEIDRVGGGLGIDYFISPYATASLDYIYEDQEVARDVFNGGFDTNYDVHQVLLMLSFKR